MTSDRRDIPRSVPARGCEKADRYVTQEEPGLGAAGQSPEGGRRRRWASHTRRPETRLPGLQGGGYRRPWLQLGGV